MSSATSIDRDAGLKTADAGLKTADAGLKTRATESFGVWHFFVLLSLMAATVAVLLTRENTPENLVLISLTIGAAGAAGAGLYRTLAPLARPDRELSAEPLSARLRADLEREKALALRSIKELEFDRAMGKVSPQDFDEMASRLRSRALGLMKQLDAGNTIYKSVIEKELQSRLQHRQSATAPQVRAAHVCACGTTNDTDARFCKSCGTKLELA